MKTEPLTGYKAMILAAGLGTRLKPITESMPKALVRVGNRTLLEIAIEHLTGFGIQDILINVHHFADQVIQYLAINNNIGISITVSDESAELLDTGGGVKKAETFFSDGPPFIVRNADIISDLDLAEMVSFHLIHKPIATLAVRERETSRYFLFDPNGQLSGWTNKKTGEVRYTRENRENLRELAFSGIQVLDPSIFPLITETGKFSLTELYLRLSTKEKILGFKDTGSLWRDVGKSPEDLKIQD
jgi:NDP-sugar pyrophosphorylase family protein